MGPVLTLHGAHFHLIFYYSQIHNPCFLKSAFYPLPNSLKLYFLILSGFVIIKVMHIIQNIWQKCSGKSSLFSELFRRLKKFKNVKKEDSLYMYLYVYMFMIQLYCTNLYTHLKHTFFISLQKFLVLYIGILNKMFKKLCLTVLIYFNQY
jgi:hypothetical protein